MLFYQVHLEGTEDEIQKMIDELSEYDEFFSEEGKRKIIARSLIKITPALASWSNSL